MIGAGNEEGENMKKFILTMIMSVITAQSVFAGCPLSIAGGGRGSGTTITGETTNGSIADSL